MAADLRIRIRALLGPFRMSLMTAAGLGLVGACSGQASERHQIGATDGGGDGSNDAQGERPCVAELGGFEWCEPGYWHRPSTGECASHPVPDSGVLHADAGHVADSGTSVPTDGGNLSGCATDGDCTARPLGRCAEYYISWPARTFARCEYDSDDCVNDSDCGPNAICLCGTINRCVSAAACKGDVDCGSAMQCVVTGGGLDPCGYPRTSQTECIAPLPWPPSCSSDAECASSYERCIRGQCTQTAVCGRPFLVLERRRLFDELRALVEREVAVCDLGSAPVREHSSHLAAHGVLDEDLRRAVRSSALREVVLPCLSALTPRSDPQSASAANESSVSPPLPLAGV